MRSSLAALHRDPYTFTSGDGSAGALYRILRADVSDPERAGLERFIGDVFFRTYEARITHFCNTLIGCRDESGKWIAALGFSLVDESRGFVEQYLDVPIEVAIAERTGMPVTREQIAEVGNLAALHRGGARALIVFMTRYLQQQGLSWVAFTATRSLLNSFTRLHIDTSVLAEADPARLADAGKSWGSYYTTRPQVMCGNIREGYAKLAQ